MNKINYQGKLYDSIEEINFTFWLEEAYDMSFIKSYQYKPRTMDILKPVVSLFCDKKVRVDNVFRYKTILPPLSYTLDFHIRFNEKADFLFNMITKGKIDATKYNDTKKPFICNCFYDCPVDTKGSFSIYHDNVKFGVLQKIIYATHNCYVNKVIPDKLFRMTWVPEKAKYTFKTKKLKEKRNGEPKYKNYRSLIDYVILINSMREE